MPSYNIYYTREGEKKDRGNQKEERKEDGTIRKDNKRKKGYAT